MTAGTNARVGLLFWGICQAETILTMKVGISRPWSECCCPTASGIKKSFKINYIKHRHRCEAKVGFYFVFSFFFF